MRQMSKSTEHTREPTLYTYPLLMASWRTSNHLSVLSRYTTVSPAIETQQIIVQELSLAGTPRPSKINAITSVIPQPLPSVGRPQKSTFYARGCEYKQHGHPLCIYSMPTSSLALHETASPNMKLVFNLVYRFIMCTDRATQQERQHGAFRKPEIELTDTKSLCCWLSFPAVTRAAKSVPYQAA